MNIRVIFGEVLRQTRMQKHISQEQLALDADLDRSYVSKLECGVYQPSLSTLFALAQVLECRPRELVDRVEEKMTQAEP